MHVLVVVVDLTHVRSRTIETNRCSYPDDNSLLYHFEHALTIVAQLILSPSSKGKTSQLLVKVTIH